MTFTKSLPLLLLLLTITACSKPVPVSKAAYVGEWQAPEMYLLITPEGRVDYKRHKDGGMVSVKGPLQKFQGKNFLVGYGFFTTTFTVNIPPYLSDDGIWRMVVNGVELVRSREFLPSRKVGIMV